MDRTLRLCVEQRWRPCLEDEKTPSSVGNSAVTGARGGEPCLCVKVLTYLALSFIGEAKLLIGRDMVIRSISLELQHEL